MTAWRHREQRLAPTPRLPPPHHPPPSEAGLSDPDALASVAAAVKADFANGDTMGDMGLSFWAASVAAGNPLAFQPEGGGSIASLQWVKTGWGEGWPAPFIPNVDVERWTETRHVSQICDRWATDHTADLQQARGSGGRWGGRRT